MSNCIFTVDGNYKCNLYEHLEKEEKEGGLTKSKSEPEPEPEPETVPEGETGGYKGQKGATENVSEGETEGESKPEQKKKRKLNPYMVAKEKARKANADSFEYNGKTYYKKKTKTGMTIYSSKK